MEKAYTEGWLRSQIYHGENQGPPIPGSQFSGQVAVLCQDPGLWLENRRQAGQLSLSSTIQSVGLVNRVTPEFHFFVTGAIVAPLTTEWLITTEFKTH